MINCDKIVKFQNRDAELIDMLKNLQKDVRSLENAYMSRLGKVGEAWRFLIRKSNLLTEECMCTELRNLIKMAEWKDEAYRNDRENIRRHYMRFFKEFENKVEEWFFRNFCIHPHDESVITGNFDQRFGSMDEFMDFAKKDMEKNDHE